MGSKADPIVWQLRERQEEDERFGQLFNRLHVFIDRTIARFFDDVPDLPYPVISLDQDRKGRRGRYHEQDGLMLAHRINADPWQHHDAEALACTLVHELVHLWEAHIGEPTERNYHGANFHRRMWRMGIETEGKTGKTKHWHPTWSVWLVENADLELEKFILPGADVAPARQMLKHQCPECGISFHTRQRLNVLCLDCFVDFEVSDGEEEDDS